MGKEVIEKLRIVMEISPEVMEKIPIVMEKMGSVMELWLKVMESTQNRPRSDANSHKFVYY
ncbi:hypothetical protein [Falsibacillus albus]|uniref:hypothetical protein n=1 Tax=Falsibacillus albus TaxID=2478915 RepID=UPI0011E60365|nr:hypothetical protein [Falsibacillus albus]